MERKIKLKDFLPITLFFAGAVLILITSFHYFRHEITGIMEDKVIAKEIWYGIVLRIHIVFGIIAIFSGPLQFVKSIRMRKMKFHRRAGYLYSFSVLISSITGLIVAQFAIGGIISTLGFSALSIFWGFSIIKSVQSIRNKEIERHKKWMFINYGLTFSAIPQRFFLALALVVDIKFVEIYKMSAWIPWILNTLIAYFLYQRALMKETEYNLEKRKKNLS